MQVSVESISPLGRRLTVQIPAGEIKTAIRDKMSELSQKAQVSGFRPGKIPKHVLEQRFGSQVRQDAVGKVIETSLPVALEQNDLKPAGRPVVESITNDGDKDLEYIVSFEIFPEFTLLNYADIKVEKYTATVTDQDVNSTVEKLKVQFSDWVPVERSAKESDRLTVDYTSLMNGKPYENNSGQDVLVEIGSKLFIEGFEQGLLGASVGDERNLALIFPADWRMEKLAGKPVQFTVRVKAIAERKPAELNESFAKKIGAEASDEKAIREKIRENLSKQVVELSESKLKDEITNALLKLNPIPLPQALVEREMSALHEDYHRRLGDKPETACHHHGLLEQAEKRVALGLILNEVIKSEKITPDQEQIKTRIASLAKMFGNTEFLESMYYESEELLAGVRHTVLLDQALDLVVSKATVIETAISVQDLFNRESK